MNIITDGAFWSKSLILRFEQDRGFLYVGAVPDKEWNSIAVFKTIDNAFVGVARKKTVLYTFSEADIPTTLVKVRQTPNAVLVPLTSRCFMRYKDWTHNYEDATLQQGSTVVTLDLKKQPFSRADLTKTLLGV